MMSDERDLLTEVYSASKLMADFAERRGHKFLVVAVANVRQIVDFYGLSEGDESVKRLAAELVAAYGDRVYRISHARFVVKDPDLTRLFDLQHAFAKREAVASCILRVDDHDPAAAELKGVKDLLKLLSAVRLDDLGAPSIAVKFA